MVWILTLLLFIQTFSLIDSADCPAEPRMYAKITSELFELMFCFFSVLQVRSDLTDYYYEELQEEKTRHALELEQLRAKLSEHHLQGFVHILQN